jgi:dna gyrase subunit a protein
MDNFRINESQANYIATSATQTLINSDFQDLLKKIKEIKEEITHYKELITNDEKKKEYMIDEWKEIKKKYGWERKTKIIQEDDIKKVNLNTVENKYEDKEYLIVATKNYILKT